MAEPFVGSEAVARGALLKSALRTQYTKLLRDVYVNRDTELTPQLRAQAGWLWSRRRGIIAGLSASAIHGAKWVDVAVPVESSTPTGTRCPDCEFAAAASKKTKLRWLAAFP